VAGLALLGLSGLGLAASVGAGRVAGGAWRPRAAAPHREEVKSDPVGSLTQDFANSAPKVVHDEAGLKFPALPCNTAQETPTLNTEGGAKFVTYMVKEGDVVEPGAAVAVLQRGDDLYVLLKAAVPGVVKHIYAGLKAGMELDTVVPSRNLATIAPLAGPGRDPGDLHRFSPYSLYEDGAQVPPAKGPHPAWWLLPAVLLLTIFGLCYLIFRMETSRNASNASSYTPMPTSEETESERLVVPEPDGVKLVFDDSGTTRTVYAKYQPLGFGLGTGQTVVQSFRINSYAKMSLGVQIGWRLTHVGSEDLSGKSKEDVASRLRQFTHTLPVWPLPLEFVAKASSEPIVLEFTEKPIGITFQSSDPTEVTQVLTNGIAASKGVQPGWKLTKVGEIEVHKSTVPEIKEYLKEATMSLTERA